MEADLLKLSLQAYTGEYTPETTKLQGVYKNQLVQILVKSGSTYNFLDTTLATKLNMVPDSPNNLEVVVANGARLRSSGCCGKIQWTVQGQTLVADFHLLPLREYDIVLGIQWLRTLGPIVWDFSKTTYDLHSWRCAGDL